VLGGDLARSARTFRTMAVEDSETSRPVNSATFVLTPAAMRTANVTSVASPTCRPPPTNIGRRRSLSRSRLNSRPIVKSRSSTPTSAAASTISWSLTSPRALGPMTTPVRRKATIGTSRSRNPT
jgi:hypothetical protein